MDDMIFALILASLCLIVESQFAPPPPPFIKPFARLETNLREGNLEPCLDITQRSLKERGTYLNERNITATGVPCQMWPDAPHNFCENSMHPFYDESSLYFPPWCLNINGTREFCYEYCPYEEPTNPLECIFNMLDINTFDERQDLCVNLQNADNQCKIDKNSDISCIIESAFPKEALSLLEKEYWLTTRGLAPTHIHGPLWCYDLVNADNETICLPLCKTLCQASEAKYYHAYPTSPPDQDTIIWEQVPRPCVLEFPNNSKYKTCFFRPQCNETGVYTGNLNTFLDRDSNRQPCKRWDDIILLQNSAYQLKMLNLLKRQNDTGDHNYCRVPKIDEESFNLGPWCFDPQTSARKSCLNPCFQPAAGFETQARKGESLSDKFLG